MILWIFILYIFTAAERRLSKLGHVQKVKTLIKNVASLQREKIKQLIYHKEEARLSLEGFIQHLW